MLQACTIPIIPSRRRGSKSLGNRSPTVSPCTQFRSDPGTRNALTRTFEGIPRAIWCRSSAFHFSGAVCETFRTAAVFANQRDSVSTCSTSSVRLRPKIKGSTAASSRDIQPLLQTLQTRLSTIVLAGIGPRLSVTTPCCTLKRKGSKRNWSSAKYLKDHLGRCVPGSVPIPPPFGSTSSRTASLQGTALEQADLD